MFCTSKGRDFFSSKKASDCTRRRKEGCRFCKGEFLPPSFCLGRKGGRSCPSSLERRFGDFISVPAKQKSFSEFYLLRHSFEIKIVPPGDVVRVCRFSTRRANLLRMVEAVESSLQEFGIRQAAQQSLVRVLIVVAVLPFQAASFCRHSAFQCPYCPQFLKCDLDILRKSWSLLERDSDLPPFPRKRPPFPLDPEL